MTLAITLLTLLAAILGFVIPILKKRMEVKSEDHSALNQLGASEFHAGVTGGVQPPTAPLRPE